MARTTDPLRRENIAVIAQLPTARVTAPVDNGALRLARGLAAINPEARRTMQGIAEERAAKAREQAKKDAIQAAGADLADAVREGKLRPTQNPWYVDAYNREAAAITAQDSLQTLQSESATWEERNDPQAFQQRWRAEVGELASAFEGPEQSAGFTAAEAAVTSQVLQQNVARNAARIEEERAANLGRLSSDALQRIYVEQGGRLSPNQVWNALLPAREQWFGTGGDAEGWNAILVQTITTTAYANKNPDILDLLRSPELLSGPTQAGDIGVLAPDQPYSGVTITEVPPAETPAEGEEPSAPTLTVSAPRRSIQSAPWPAGSPAVVTSGFGRRGSGSHNAVDLGLPVGTPVRARSTGRVVAVDNQEGLGGLFVRVDYGNGVEESYAHLSSQDVKVGDVVAEGQVLGKVGRTGRVRAQGGVLHWSMFVNGERVDPTSYRGQMGGDFEGVTREEAPPQSFTGFPGRDQPFQADGSQQQLPASGFAFGPSLYGLPGVADQVEADRYRISQNAEEAPLREMRRLNNVRTARAYEARDSLFEQYGTGLLTGAVTRETIIADLNGKGYSAPEIALALNFVRDGLQDSVGVATAQIAARGQNPGSALQILDLEVEGRTNGWSQSYEDRVSDAVLRGDITGDDGVRMIDAAQGRSRQQEADARAAQAREEAAATAPGATVRSATALNSLSKNLAAATVLKLRDLTRSARVIDSEGDIEASIIRAARAHLAVNPGDWDGAVSAARNEAGRIIQATATTAGATRLAPTQNRSGGNPRE